MPPATDRALMFRQLLSSYPISSALYLSKPEPLPLVEGPSAAPSYFHSVQDFNALNYLIMTLKSPMILMAVGAWAMVTLLPKLTVSAVVLIRCAVEAESDGTHILNTQYLPSYLRHRWTLMPSRRRQNQKSAVLFEKLLRRSQLVQNQS